MSARSPIVASPLPERSTPTTPVRADAAMHLDAPFLQLARDQIGGAVLLQPEFRIGVDVLADRGEFGVVAADLVDRRGHVALLLSWRATHRRIASACIDDLAVQHDALDAAPLALAERALRRDADLIHARLARRRLDARDQLRHLRCETSGSMHRRDRSR